MKKSQERLGAMDYEKAEEGLLKVFKADKKNSLQDAELKELRRMAERLWEKLEMEKALEEGKEWMASEQVTIRHRLTTGSQQIKDDATHLLGDFCDQAL